MNKQNDMQEVAFLDTNALHYMRIYLAYLEERQYPDMREMMKGQLKRQLEAERKQKNLNDAHVKSVRKGFGVIDFLRSNKIKAEYSPISELELILGRVRGTAVLAAARENVPDRMWSKFLEQDVRERTNATETQKIMGRISEFFDALEKLEIIIGRSQSSSKNTLTLAKEIVGLIYMEGMDSIIYAEALISQADFLITFDGSFKEAVNAAHSPSNSHYKDIALNLKKRVHEATLIPETKVVLPYTPTVPF